MIPDTVVDEVRDRADIVELIGEHVPLKRAGKEFRALCPFHQEKTPSFYVVPAKGFYKCFGCGESGDVFTFLMKRLGLGFQDAVRQVAQRVGVEIPDTSRARQADEAHQPLYEAVAFAADYYQRQLWGDEGEHARRYLKERGIAREAAERFLLGYAPDEWRALRAAAHTHGIDDSVLLEAGLIKESERAEEPYDRQRDRLIFPITDVRGRVIAFGGRVLGKAGEGAPKYLNSPETPIYQKGQILYGLAWAKAAIRREGVALVVEGNMDYVSLAAAGVDHVVAPLGTALTAEQAALLARYTEKALLLYDSDAAGLRATFRSADALLRVGVHPLVVTLPAGADPDSLVRGGGAAALQPHLDAAVDVVDRKLAILEERGFFRDIEGIRKALDRLLPTLRAAADAPLRDIYVARIAAKTGVRRETLEQEIASVPAAPVRAAGRAGAALAPRPAARSRGMGAQRKLLLLLLRDPARLSQAAAELTVEEFGDPVYRELYAALTRPGGVSGDAPVLGEPARLRLEELRQDPEELSDGDRIFEESVRAIRRDAVYFRQLDELDREIALAIGDDARLAELTMEKRKVAHVLQSMGYQLDRMLRKRARRERQEPPNF